MWFRKKTKKPSDNSISMLYRKPGAFLLTLAIVITGGALTISLLSNGVRINHDGYQVVYMATGQAYFGKLKNTTGNYLVLDTPYTAQDVQPQADNEQASAQSSTTLLKVSQQQYGPEEKLSLKADQVLFWQNLRDDSKVSQAIKSQK